MAVVGGGGGLGGGIIGHPSFEFVYDIWPCWIDFTRLFRDNNHSSYKSWKYRNLTFMLHLLV